MWLPNLLEGCGSDVWMAQPGPCSGEDREDRAVEGPWVLISHAGATSISSDEASVGFEKPQSQDSLSFSWLQLEGLLFLSFSWSFPFTQQPLTTWGR